MSTRTNVIEWASERGILEASDPKTQLLKSMSEFGELADAVAKVDATDPLSTDTETMAEIADAIGDVRVTLILLSQLLCLNDEACLDGAFRVIMNRTGKMVNGVFVRD